MKRRALVLGGLGYLVWPALAWAGSYLDRASWLVVAAGEDLAYLRRKQNDLELARLVHEVAAARLRSAETMSVPPEVVQAHPHLLLLLENCERAANAAMDKQPEQFAKFVRLARDEEELFRAVLRHLGWQLPRPRESGDGRSG